MIKNQKTADQYYCGDGVCEGWRLFDGGSLSVIEEKMPPRTFEVTHFHRHANQVFYVLAGTLTIDVERNVVHLSKGDRLYVQPGKIHQVRNENATDDTFFLVIFRIQPREIVNK